MCIVTVLLGLSATLNIILMLYLISIKEKNTMIYWNISFLSFLLVWVWGYFSMILMYLGKGYVEVVFVNIAYIGMNFFAVTFMISGYVYNSGKVKLSKKAYLLFAFPLISVLIIITNCIHSLFYKEYSIWSGRVVTGMYYNFHIIGCYIFILLGLYFFTSSVIKTSSIFSKRTFIVLIAYFFPIIFLINYIFRFFNLPTAVISIVFSICSWMLFLVIYKYKFLMIGPIAIEQVVDRISDSYIVINDYKNIVDFNKTMESSIKGITKISRGYNIEKFLDKVVNNSHNFKHFIKRTMKEKKTFNFEVTFKDDEPMRYFKVETTPITGKISYVGTIILFKDITEHKNFIKMMNESYSMLMDKERLVTLGQFMGGIAHNIKTPIMSISGGLDAIKELIDEYDDSIEDISVTADDHHEIANEMREWIKKNMSTVKYISDIISTVKSQAVGNDSIEEKFTISNLIKRIEILMDHGLRLQNCKLKITNNLNDDYVLSGNITSLIQIFNNIIVNAADSYGGKGGVIEMFIDDKDGRTLFIVEDKGKGIDRNIQSKLFKEMVTTKGMNGTGLGLYISYSTIKVMFKGEIWFESEPEKGTKFYILI